MKKYSYIVLVVLAVAVSSCHKEVISPSESCTSTRPNWESESDMNKQNGKSSTSSDKALGDDDTNGGSIIIETGSSDTGITDPNKDPDANKHKGGRGRR